MKTKLFVLALASCLEIFATSGSAQAQIFGYRGRHWNGGGEAPGYYDGIPGYAPAVYGKYGPGIYNGYGTRFYGLPDYGAAMNLYGFPNPVYPPYSPYSAVTAYPHSRGVIDPSITSAPITTDITTPPSGSLVATQSFYSGPSSASNKAEFRVKVPVPNAKVYFNDNLIEQEGTDRKLITPTLHPGTYNYRVRATWTENGQTQSQEKKLSVQPGQVMSLVFGKVE